MTTLSIQPLPFEAYVSEAPGYISRDVVTVLSGVGVIKPNTILAKITASGKFTPAKATGSDGSQTAVAVALYGCDATSADAVVTVLARTAEVNGAELVRDATITAGTLTTAQNAQLAAVGIIVR